MTAEDVMMLGGQEEPKTLLELEATLAELKSFRFGKLVCIKYVKDNQRCSLQEAVDIVINSAAWIDEKQAFLDHQEEQMREFLEAAPKGTTVQMEITPKGTTITLNRK